MLWVRTQDKKRLVAVSGVIAKKTRVERAVGSGFLDGLDNNVMGKYADETRCLEVLDDIQTKIEESTEVFVLYTMPSE